MILSNRKIPSDKAIDIISQQVFPSKSRLWCEMWLTGFYAIDVAPLINEIESLKEEKSNVD